jgi:hypothetical protein
MPTRHVLVANGLVILALGALLGRHWRAPRARCSPAAFPHDSRSYRRRDLGNAVAKARMTRQVDVRMLRSPPGLWCQFTAARSAIRKSYPDRLRGLSTSWRFRVGLSVLRGSADKREVQAHGITPNPVTVGRLPARGAWRSGVSLTSSRVG